MLLILVLTLGFKVFFGTWTRRIEVVSYRIIVLFGIFLVVSPPIFCVLGDEIIPLSFETPREFLYAYPYIL